MIYLVFSDQHQFLKNRQQRLEILRTLLKDEEETKNDDFFMKKYDEMKELMIERVDTFYSEERYPEPHIRYSPEKSRLEVDVYKQLYTISYERKAWIEFTFEFARDGFSAGFLGYQNSENQELKESFKYDCENFAKLAETLQNTLGKVLVKPQLWKRRQNVKSYVLEKRMSSASKSR